MNLKTLAGIAASVAIAQFAAQANPITVDEILHDGTVDASKLSGVVNMSADNGNLIIDLQNTSQNAAGSGAGVLLTGIGMVFPGWATITGGSANMGSSTAIGFIKPLDGDVSEEWGYDADPLQSGALLNTINPVNTAVSSMESQTTDQFAPGSIFSPGNLNGPDGGLASANETDPFGMGVEAIRDSIRITLNLVFNGNKNVGNLISYIEDNWVALTFGSPTTAKPPTTVPEGGATAILLGLGLWGTELLRKRARARK